VFARVLAIAISLERTEPEARWEPARYAASAEGLP